MNFKEFINEAKIEAPDYGEFDTKEELFKWFGSQTLDTSTKTDLFADGKVWVTAGTTLRTAASKIPELGKMIDIKKRERESREYDAARKRLGNYDPNKRTLTQDDYNKIAWKMDHAIGYVMDGDPTDIMMDYLKKNFNITPYTRPSLIDVLNKVAKTKGKFKDWYDMLANIWADVVADNPEHGKETGGRNPWK